MGIMLLPQQPVFIADARQSPLVALMKSLAYQGGVGVPQALLSVAVVTRDRNFFS
jgi:type VI secretion system protein ImpL